MCCSHRTNGSKSPVRPIPALLRRTSPSRDGMGFSSIPARMPCLSMTLARRMRTNEEGKRQDRSERGEEEVSESRSDACLGHAMHLFRSTRRGEEGEGGCRATPAVGNAGRFGVFHHEAMRFPYMHMPDGACCSSVSSPFFPGLDRSSAECQVWCEVDQGDPARPRVRLGRAQVGP